MSRTRTDRRSAAGATAIADPAEGEPSLPACRRAEALLAATTAGTTSLLLGGGCERLELMIARLGGRVIAAGFNRAGTAPATTASAQDDRLRVETRPDHTLPFADRSFDSVFAPRWFEIDSDPGPPTAATRERILRECARVLRPGGRLVLWVPNRSAAAMLFRWLQRRARGGSSPAQLEQLLRAAGLETGTVYVPWPGFGTWTALVPVSVARQYRLPTAPTRRARLLRPMREMARRLGAATWLVPEYCVVATRADDRVAGAPPAVEPVLSRLVLDAGLMPAAADRIVLNAQGERVITFACQGAFFKIPVTPLWEERLRVEMDGNARAQATPARHFMIALHRQGQLGPVPYAVFPVAEIPTYGGEAGKLAVLEETFTRLAAGAGTVELRGTDAWTRIFSEPSYGKLIGVGADDLLGHLRDACAGTRSVAGLTHGDLHVGNVLQRNGEIALIDWDRFEARSPLILDRVNAVYRLMVRRRNVEEATYLDVLRQLARREPGTPLLQRIDEVAGDLSWRDIIVLFVLSGASWRLLQTPAASVRRAEEAVRNQTALCRSCWDPSR